MASTSICTCSLDGALSCCFGFAYVRIIGPKKSFPCQKVMSKKSTFEPNAKTRCLEKCLGQKPMSGTKSLQMSRVFFLFLCLIQFEGQGSWLGQFPFPFCWRAQPRLPIFFVWWVIMWEGVGKTLPWALAPQVLFTPAADWVPNVPPPKGQSKDWWGVSFLITGQDP